MSRKRRYLTLIEIMIVIALIGLIGSVVAYNLKGSLNEGKMFKTAQAKEQINDILWLEVASGRITFDEAVKDWQNIVQRSPLAKDGKQLVRDGWNQLFEVSSNGSDFVITSAKYDQYDSQRKNK
jgi:general secretion pathway protein G